MIQTQPEPLGVVIVILNTSDQTVLLGKRKNSYMSGSYGLPGGRIELKEPIISAAIRELQEETNLAVQENQLEYLGVIRELQDTYNFIHFVFLLKNPETHPINTEPEKCEGWEWVSLKSLPTNLLRGHQAAVELYMKKKLYIDLF